MFCRLSAASAERPPPPQWQMIIAFGSGTFSSMSSSTVPRLRCVAPGMCPSFHSSLSRTSMITASPLFDFAAASCGEISVMFFLASATSFSKRACSAIPKCIRRFSEGHFFSHDLHRSTQVFEELSKQLHPESAKSVAILLIAQRFDRIERRGFARGIKTEENTDGRAEQERNGNRTDGNQRGPVGVD